MTPSPAPSPIVVQVLGNESSFWDSPLLLALGGVIVGALLGFLSTKFQDDRKAKREDDQRWYDHVRSLSAEAVALISEYVNVVHRILDRNQHDDEANDDPDALFEPAQEVFNRLSAVYGQLTLVAPKDLDDAMERVMNASLSLSSAFYRGDGLDGATKEVAEAGTVLIATVRSYLKVDEKSAP